MRDIANDYRGCKGNFIYWFRLCVLGVYKMQSLLK